MKSYWNLPTFLNIYFWCVLFDFLTFQQSLSLRVKYSTRDVIRDFIYCEWPASYEELQGVSVFESVRADWLCRFCASFEPCSRRCPCSRSKEQNWCWIQTVTSASRWTLVMQADRNFLTTSRSVCCREKIRPLAYPERRDKGVWIPLLNLRDFLKIVFAQKYCSSSAPTY